MNESTPASLEDKVNRLEQDIGVAAHVSTLTGRILSELMRSEPPPAELEKARGFLRSARDLLKQGEQETPGQLYQQAADAYASVQQWLAVGDLAIGPFVLRTFLEKNPPEREQHKALIRYFLQKRPHAENDRDKLDYLVTAYFAPRSTGGAELLSPSELPRALEALFAGCGSAKLSDAAGVMLDELESLSARIEDYTTFDQLVHARMVERVRALKTNLREEFYHPQVLKAVVRFNTKFRLNFESLFRQQLEAVRRETREQLEQAWELVRAIEEAYEDLSLPKEERVSPAPPQEAAQGAEERVGRPLEALEERPPIERLVRRDPAAQKEKELSGIVARLARFIEKLPPDQAKAEKILFTLRQGQVELSRWEREAFGQAAGAAAPESVRAIQYALGLMALTEEELMRYREARSDRYRWKTHFDLLGYSVGRSVELLETIRGLIRKGAPAGEAAWFGPLVQTALRLATLLNRVGPVFEGDKAA
ncbi:MAG: hypothetical protein ACE5IP_11155 [Terriglobia bacterium]